MTAYAYLLSQVDVLPNSVLRTGIFSEVSPTLSDLIHCEWILIHKVSATSYAEAYKKMIAWMAAQNAHLTHECVDADVVTECRRHLKKEWWKKMAKISLVSTFVVVKAYSNWFK